MENEKRGNVLASIDDDDGQHRDVPEMRIARRKVCAILKCARRYPHVVLRNGRTLLAESLIDFCIYIRRAVGDGHGSDIWISEIVCERLTILLTRLCRKKTSAVLTYDNGR